jgi:formate-dependent phosphoribosylglycinamide formyltransferase (GAR transformylase)
MAVTLARDASTDAARAKANQAAARISVSLD